MAPKFKGDSEDWLDDEAARGHGGKGAAKIKSSNKPAAAALDPAAANATIAEVFPKQCRARLDEDASEVLCGYRRAAVFGNDEEMREKSPVAVGDRVRVDRLSPDSGVVVGLCARRNVLARPAPGRDRLQKKVRQVIAANTDVLVVVASVAEPVFSPGLVDRFLVAARAAGIHPLVCITKVDLWQETEKPWQIYSELGFELFEVSARTGVHVEELRRRLNGYTAVFCGHSGVGKTSLLRKLLDAEIGKVGTISDATGKGRHTTTSAVLLNTGTASAGPLTAWIDTPGVREFGLLGVTPESLAGFFPEFESISCAEPGCLHLDEDGCGAQELLRYPSYRRILESLLAGEN